MPIPPASARVLLIDAQSERTDALAAGLATAGLVVLDVVAESGDVHAAIRAHNPDVILIGADSPTRDTVEGLAVLGRHFPRPILMLSESSDTELVHHAARLGISTYAVDGVSPLLLRSLLEVSTAHFKNWRLLQDELEEAQQILSDRRAVERAKYRLVEALGLTEDEAYHRLRRQAMEQGMKLGDVARAMLAADDPAPTKQESPGDNP